MIFAIVFLAATAPVVLAKACSPFHLVYARATTEPPQGVDEATGSEWEAKAAKIWSKGWGAAGYSLFTNLTSLLPGTTGYPVHYPASTGNSAPKGITDMISHITEVAKECPETKFALGGHSQGGMVTVGAIPKIPKELISRVVAVAMFGSPPCPAVVADRCNSYCNKGDFVCDREGSGKGKGKGKGGLPALVTRNIDLSHVAPDCASVQNVEVRGHQNAKGGNAHLAYNIDGYYVYAAACYVASQFKKSGGA